MTIGPRARPTTPWPRRPRSDPHSAGQLVGPIWAASAQRGARPRCPGVGKCFSSASGGDPQPRGWPVLLAGMLVEVIGYLAAEVAMTLAVERYERRSVAISTNLE